MTIATADHFSPPQERLGLPVSFAAALLLEGLCFLAAVGWLAQHPPTNVSSGPTMQISLVAAPPAPAEAPADPLVAETPPAPEETPPEVIPPPAEVPPPPAEVAPPEPAPPPPKAPVVRPKPAKTQPQVQRKPAARPAQQQAAASTPSAGAMSSFQGQMRRAVESALIYPASARASGQHGRARVTFDYLDGRVSGVSLSQSSGSSVLDQAAIATVRSAHYPPPPPEMSHRTLHLSIFVEFKAGM